MGINCGAKCAQWVLFIFNIIFFLGGAAVLGVGIWIVVDTKSYYDFLMKVDPNGNAAEITGNILSQNVTYIQTIGYILIGVGSFVFGVGFLGCCGAAKKWRPLLVSYAILLIIVMCVEVGVGIAVGVYKNDVVAKISDEMKTWAKSYDLRFTDEAFGKLRPLATPNLDNNPSVVAATNGWNAMQVYLQCCGAESYIDFTAAGTPYAGRFPGQATPAPAFCCKMDNPLELHLQDPSCATTRTPSNSNMNIGCVPKVVGYINDNAPAIIGVAVGIGLIELVGIVFAFCLCCAIGDKGRRYN